MSVDPPYGAGALLERDQILSVLRDLLVGIRSSRQGRLLMVGGEAGVGKTALLRRFCDEPRPGVRILWGGCEPLGTPRPLGPIQDIVADVGGELASAVARDAKPHEIAMAMLGELRARAPTVLVLEDLHWADEATIDVLGVLAARIASAPALVLASYRDDELDRAEQLRRVLGELVRGPNRLGVPPLSQAAVSELARPHGFDAHELYRRTGGNPFFLTEVLAAGGTEIPETVRDAVLARAARLSTAARALLQAVAVVPGQVELWLLERLDGPLTGRLEECLGSGMLKPEVAQVAFRHELARLAVEEAMAPNRRVELHRAALAALAADPEGAGPDPARLAHHAEAAGDRRSVLRWAPVAARRAAASGAHREAAAHYARALRFAHGLPLSERADLLESLAHECYMTDQLAEAIEAQQEALAHHRALGDQRSEGNSMRALSRLLFFVGRTDEAEPIALQAVQLLERLAPGHELAMAYGNVSQRRMVVEDTAEALTWGGRALDLARELDDAEATVYALINIGAAELGAGADGGRAKLEDALALARHHGLEEYAGRAFLLLVYGSLQTRQLAVAERYVEPALQYCADRDLGTWRLYLLACRARLELELGRWDQAGDLATAVLRDRRSAPVPRIWALTVVGLLRARRGDPEASAPLLEALELVAGTGEIDRIGSVAAARAEHAWLRGATADVKLVTDSALSLARRRDSGWVLAELTYWRWRAGVRDEPLADQTPYRLSLAGDSAGAAALWRESGHRYETALALADSDDEQQVREALDLLRALGARPAISIVTRRLRERGVRGIPRGPRPRTRQNPAGLTPRELEVLTHLSDGMRNAQIASCLFVSEKTVDHHVSAVLRKLGVQTRGEASAEALRLGLTSPK